MIGTLTCLLILKTFAKDAIAYRVPKTRPPEFITAISFYTYRIRLQVFHELH